MMVRAGLCIGMDRHRAGPDLLGAGTGPVDRRRPVHAGCLRRIRID